MESEGPLCQMKMRTRHDVSSCHLKSNGHCGHGTSHLTHQTRVGHPGDAGPIRHRGSGALASICNSPDCLASRVREEETLEWSFSSGKVLVTGGGGYFGFRLGKELASQGMSVILLDKNRPPDEIPAGAVFCQNDIRDYSSLHKLCEGVDCIFHSASYGMSGPEQLRKEQVESINVGGTNNVIKVCKERSIPRLIYTSTINVVFAGEPIDEGDESSVPPLPPEQHIDHYSRTKAIAEQMVLSANGCSLKGGGLLRTCVLRPCGIYGPEERRHLHRVMVNVERRLFSFRFGDERSRMNWVHVDNLILAHTLAAQALTPKRSCVASGQVYFINDGISVNLFEWLTPLFEKLGYSRPMINLPFSLVYSAAVFVEYLHIVLRPIVEVPLLFTSSEVRNIAVSHTFKIDKARRELGYAPKPFSLADSVEQCLKTRPPPSSAPHVMCAWTHHLPGHLRLLLVLGLGLMLLMLCCLLRQD
ncbi:putative short-chain dehydrogenase/reductase family 42E member 2 [Synchiropus splendidus]|uniref:putative short-chain dehydrogenase/reductase family 42E member 2 n=1 Tax=Synchiropus splendidus TaxID=270530 RepID=UPI00237D3A76|nr:putative short-chain dehydrogenase/reductase family 42E member 2 [Synchiropus splendidus]XP_053708690.1 putative short-chain dehydrogenase/reductase family 42E member 2 [Synchiropus splendidus]XP_053708691.1 putative short-chain dehydrogenase/reductase family 42E member 2 [Synchiropus splendidus]